MTIVELPDKNITLINLNDLFSEQISSKILNDLKTYKLTDKPLSNKDVKKLFYHHIIYNITETILNKSSNSKPILLLSDSQFTTQIDICKYYDELELLSFIAKLISKLETMLPVRVVYITACTPASMIIDASMQKVKTVSSKNFTFEKIKLFAKRNELTFLSNDYLNQFKTKQIMI